MNEAKRWDDLAESYDVEIFDVFKSDRKKVLPKYFKKHANKTKHAIDFGCGTGKALPYLAPVFKKVLAVDISVKCMVYAQERGYSNVDFKAVDLTKDDNDLPQTDFAFCCNVAILPGVADNYAIIRNVIKSVKKGGSAVLVIPSFESASLAAWQVMQWCKRQGTNVADIPEAELNFAGLTIENLSQGIIKLSDNPTKHYSCPELYSLINSSEFAIQNIEKVEYTWDTEFNSPPKWMQEPYPWDWLVEVKRIK